MPSYYRAPRIEPLQKLNVFSNWYLISGQGRRHLMWFNVAQKLYSRSFLSLTTKRCFFSQDFVLFLSIYLPHFNPWCSMFWMFSLVHHCCCDSMQNIILQSLFSYQSSWIVLVLIFLCFLLSPLKSCFLSLIFCDFILCHLFIFVLFTFSPSVSALFLLLPPVYTSLPGAEPQLHGIPVLLPTWGERLYPPGPPPGANDWTLQGQRQQLPHIQPQQQVGKTTTSRKRDFEWRTLGTSWCQKSGLQSRLL